MENLQKVFYQTLEKTNVDFLRYIYKEINWNSRMIGLTGARGVGKTTLILQHIKKDLTPAETLYVVADDFYFADKKLLDLAESFVKIGGKTLFIDEIHKYKEWSRELKLIYDYFPDLKVVFTGSSILDINKGVADLSRRAVMYKMQGLSFREYLQMFHNISTELFDLQQVIEQKVKISVEHPLPFFNDYLKCGYYPFCDDEKYFVLLKQLVNQTLEVDIPLFSDMNVSTGRKLKQLMALIAQSVPFKPNFTNIAKALSASRNNIADYCLFIEEAGLIAQLRDDVGGIRGLGKVDKIYLENTNLIHALAKETVNVGNIRETFFFNQTKVKYDVVSSSAADFVIDDFTFEVGGKSKEQKQIQGIKNAFVVKDDIEFGYLNIIPLWHFGFLY